MLIRLLATLAVPVSISAFAAVDVNNASQAELESITGLGPATASLIVDERRKGPFRNWTDLIGRVKGVGERSAARLSAEGLTVDGASYRGPAAKPGAGQAQGATADQRGATDTAASATRK
jgi:competence protein ComEA